MVGFIEKIQSRLLAGRAQLSGISRHGAVTVYLLRVEGCPTVHVEGYRFPEGTFPVLSERLEWLRDICASWWVLGVKHIEWTYTGPPEQPSVVKMDFPRWALPRLAQLADEALRRDRPKQRPYGTDTPYRGVR